MAWVYILQSDLDGRFYVGSTTDINRRMKQHHQGHTQTTNRMGSVKLVFSQEYSTLYEARLIEKKLKGMKRRDYLEKIVADKFIRLRAK